MTRRRCRVCVGRDGAHFGWCSTVGGPGHRRPPSTARLPHFAAPTSSWIATDVPVVVATSAVLCPDCLGDWCEACEFTGLSRPSAPQASVHQLPVAAARRGEDARRRHRVDHARRAA